MFEAAYRTSQAAIISMAKPSANPWTAAITGNGQRSGAAIARWNFWMWFPIWNAARAVSTGFVGISENPEFTVILIRSGWQ